MTCSGMQTAAQPFSREEPSAAGIRPGTAKCNALSLVQPELGAESIAIGKNDGPVWPSRDGRKPCSAMLFRMEKQEQQTFRRLTFKCKITKIVLVIHTSHPQHTVLDLLNVCRDHAPLNNSGARIYEQFAVYDSDIPVTLK